MFFVCKSMLFDITFCHEKENWAKDASLMLSQRVVSSGNYILTLNCLFLFSSFESGIANAISSFKWWELFLHMIETFQTELFD